MTLKENHVEQSPAKPQKQPQGSDDSLSSLFSKVEENRVNDEQEGNEVLDEVRSRFVSQDLPMDIIEGIL